MEGPVVKRQAASTLRSMQALARVQSQIRSRRVKMLEENQAIQRQFLQKHAKELSLQVCFFPSLGHLHNASLLHMINSICFVIPYFEIYNLFQLVITAGR